MTKDKPPLTIVSPSATGVNPPRKLGVHGQKLWAAVHNEYSITDVGGIAILAQICASADRAEALAEAIERDGETIRTKTGPRVHPAVKEELAIRAFICRGLQKLGLNVESIKSPGRPAGGMWRP